MKRKFKINVSNRKATNDNSKEFKNQISLVYISNKIKAVMNLSAVA